MQLVIWLVIKLLIKLQKSQKCYDKIIQKHYKWTWKKKKILRERYICPKERHEVIDEFRLR